MVSNKPETEQEHPMIESPHEQPSPTTPDQPEKASLNGANGAKKPEAKTYTREEIEALTKILLPHFTIFDSSVVEQALHYDQMSVKYALKHKKK